MRALRLLLVPLTLLVLESRSFELQDTIHALIEENIHLHDQLENLTQALRELKRMLRHHANDAGHHEHHSEDAQHVWDEWSQHGISAETHELLESALCGHGPHDSASSLLQRHHLLLMLLPPCLLLLMLWDWLG